MNERDVFAQRIVAQLAEDNEQIRTAYQPVNDGGFRKLIPALLQKGVEQLNLSMFSDDMRATILNSLADEYLRRGNLQGAARAYILAGNQFKLSSVGRDFEKLGLFDNAIEAYKMCGDNKHLIALGTKCMEDGRFPNAIKAFKSINSEELLRKLGNECFSKGKLNELGEACLKEGQYSYAIRAAQITQNHELLNKVGERCMREGLLHAALESVTMAKNEMMGDFIRANFRR